jgi:hypothetical protein
MALAQKLLTGQPDLDLKYLQVEISRVNLIVRRLVCCWQLAGQNMADQFRGLYLSADDAAHLAQRPLGANWGTGVALAPEDEAAFTAQEKELVRQKQALERQAASLGVALRLDYLRTAFSLSSFEYDALLVCLAPGIDLRFERLYAFLQDDVTRRLPTVGLVLDLLLSEGTARIQSMDRFNDEAPLFQWGLLKPAPVDASEERPFLRRELVPAPELISWLSGKYQPASSLAGSFHLSQDHHLSMTFLEEAERKTLDWALPGQQQPLLAFSGPDALRHLAAAVEIASAAGQPVLQVALDRLKEDERLDRNVIRLALRDSVLNQAIPFFSGWDTLITEEGTVPGAVLQQLASFSGLVITSSCAEWRVSGSGTPDLKPVLRWEIGLPAYDLRRRLWVQFSGAEQVELDLLAGQFALSSLQIQDAVLAARHAALQQRREINVEDLFEAARRQSSHQLDSLAVKIQPRYTWEDIVLPEEDLLLLREITATIRERPLVLDEWGLGRKLVASRGISMLFAGSPGTGKTLAAQVIARELGMDLYKIDLSSVVSKYIGETEKNLERIFSMASNSNALLFFDEADAIFGKRSEVKDAHDRYANIEVGYLLQRIETYEGVVILATNLRANLDDAFIRRLQFIVDFPFPDELQRFNIWTVLFPPGAPRAAEIDFSSFAKRFPLSGGNIRNAIVSATFLAASQGEPVSNRHLLHGVRREMKKMGRLIDEKDMAL